jgi:hypothetical protein
LDPKIVAQISFEETNQNAAANSEPRGKTLGPWRWRKRLPRPELRTYTVKDGHLLKTLIQAQWQFGIARFRGGASYALGDHPIAEDLRALGMGETAVERFYAPQVQSMLHPASERLPLM